MKAMVLTGKGEAEYQDVATPKCPDDGFLIRVDSVGLCGSDVRTYSHGHAHVTYPCILGHENVGTIAEIGSKVKGYEVGERVIVNPVLPCGKCWYCLKGLQELCSDKLTYGHEIQGGFAEYMVVPGIGIERGQIIKVPDDVSSDDIVVVELLSSVLNSQQLANVQVGETVVIIGTGPIGCLHSEVARLRGAKDIIMADINDERLEMCKEFSGTHFINSANEDLVKKVMEITDGFGADVVIVAAPSAQPHQQGIEMLRKQGTLVIFGGLNKDNPWTKLDANLIHYSELKVIGAFAFAPENFKKAFDIVSKKMINMDLITHKLPLKDMVKGVELLQAGKALKVVLKPQER